MHSQLEHTRNLDQGATHSLINTLSMVTDQDQESLKVSSIVEDIGNTNALIKKLEEKKKSLRWSLEQIASETGENKFQSENFTVTFKTGTELEVKPSALLEWLEENDKMDYIDVVLRVFITSLRNHLGNDIAECLGETRPKETPTMYIKERKQ